MFIKSKNLYQNKTTSLDQFHFIRNQEQQSITSLTCNDNDNFNNLLLFISIHTMAQDLFTHKY